PRRRVWRSAPARTTSSRRSRARPTRTPRCTPASRRPRATRASRRSRSGSRRSHAPRRATPAASRPRSKPSAERVGRAVARPTLPRPRTDVRKLTVDDIADMRAYERERDDFRRRIIELKRVRRVAIGPLMSIVFENTDTMRWQVQEMARVERMLRDDQIEHEVETYNQLIPEPGQLSGTLMLELNTEAALRDWLPKLVGIERQIAFTFPDGSSARGKTSDEDEQRLTREDTTAAV